MQKKEDYIGSISEYIKRNLKKGYTKESLKWALVKQGHSRLEVDKAMAKVDSELANMAPILKTKPEITLEVIEPQGAIVKKKSLWAKLRGK
ncbi:hypothetical protein FJZ18_02445 [Candidatus Pacearchaeota archaeon]|nr:hypothetical protein [Candidatus Pacearchaeota archaeon]